VTGRDVGYYTSAGLTRGGKFPFGGVWLAGYCFTRVRVTAKLSWPTLQAPEAGLNIVGLWGGAIQLGLGGASPNAWNSFPTDASIFAYDNAEADNDEKAIWSPDTATANVTDSTTRTLEWRGQYHNTESAEWYYVPVDVTDTGPEFNVYFAWQIWTA
jgi:hypothetical protein